MIGAKRTLVIILACLSFVSGNAFAQWSSFGTKGTISGGVCTPGAAVTGLKSKAQLTGNITYNLPAASSCSGHQVMIIAVAQGARNYRFTLADTDGTPILSSQANSPRPVMPPVQGQILEITVYKDPSNTQWWYSWSTRSSFAPLPSQAYYVSRTGSDNNTGTSPGNAFATFAKARQAAEGSIKTVLIEPGAYTMTATLSFMSSDANQVWLPARDPGSVIIDGAGTHYWTASGASNLTIEGLTFRHMNNVQDIFLDGQSRYVIRWNDFQNCGQRCILMHNGKATIDSNIFNGEANGGGSNCFAAVEAFYGSSNNIWRHNIVENTQAGGLAIEAGGTDPAINNNVFDRNILAGIDTNVTDCGALYLMDRTGSSTGNRITNNVVYDNTVGSNTQTKAFYLDDSVSNVVVNGNVCNKCGQWAVQYHCGANNRVINNIFDLSHIGPDAGFFYQGASWCAPAKNMAGNTFEHNIIWSSSRYPSTLWQVSGITGSIQLPAASDNLYWSANSLSIPNSNVADSAPVYSPNPAFSNPLQNNYATSANLNAIGWSPLPSDQGPLVYPYGTNPLPSQSDMGDVASAQL